MNRNMKKIFKKFFFYPLRISLEICSGNINGANIISAIVFNGFVREFVKKRKDERVIKLEGIKNLVLKFRKNIHIFKNIVT